MRAPASVVEESSLISFLRLRGQFRRFVSFLLHRYLLDVTLPLGGTSPYTRSCHRCCPVVYTYSNTWNMLAALCTSYAVVFVGYWSLHF